ncbi:cytochrome c1 [Uliginosibacterium sp. sgz301328]|uniref:cytochrome c1 n=1 Tax=Uliginosibacterium sp. sgz301328 TaxID=3243764 RepID=UPI00359D1714
MRTMTKILRSLALAGSVMLAPLAAHAEGELHLDKAPLQFDNASLQNGAKLFVNYCLNCHSASNFRYNKLEQIGLNDDQIRDNLLFTADKVGEQMKVALRHEDGKAWFGAAPPDLTLIARARASEAGSGPDWLYTYLRKFYRDDSRPTGWNNLVFPNVGMPHVLWELQGEQVPKIVTKDDGHGNQTSIIEGLEIAVPGKMSKDEYDENIADLVSFITWMGEPAQETRKTIGWFVLAVLAVLAVLTYLLKRAFWKDVH